MYFDDLSSVFDYKESMNMRNGSYIEKFRVVVSLASISKVLSQILC